MTDEQRIRANRVTCEGTAQDCRGTRTPVVAFAFILYGTQECRTCCHACFVLTAGIPICNGPETIAACAQSALDVMYSRQLQKVHFGGGRGTACGADPKVSKGCGQLFYSWPIAFVRVVARVGHSLWIYGFSASTAVGNQSLRLMHTRSIEELMTASAASARPYRTWCVLHCLLNSCKSSASALYNAAGFEAP